MYPSGVRLIRKIARLLRSWFGWIMLDMLMRERIHLVSQASRPPRDFDITFFSNSEVGPALSPELLRLQSKISSRYADILDEGMNSDSVLGRLSRAVPEFSNPNNHYIFLYCLASVLTARNVLEFGTASGTSLSSFLCADSVESITTIDVYPIDENRSWVSPESATHLNGYLSQEKERWRQVVVDTSSLKTLATVVPNCEEIDLVFVDVSHNGKDEEHIAKLLTESLKPGTIVVWDDISLSSMIAFWSKLDWDRLNVGAIGHYSGTGLSRTPAWV